MMMAGRQSLLHVPLPRFLQPIMRRRDNLLPQVLQPLNNIFHSHTSKSSSLSGASSSSTTSSLSGKISSWLKQRRHVLGVIAVLYIAVDYLRVTAPSVHSVTEPTLWAVLAIIAASKSPSYPYWNQEIRAAPAFVACLLYMLGAFCVEAIAVQFVTSVLGLDWHTKTSPLPDTGQWLFLSLNEKLPPVIVEVLRAHLFVLQHYLMLFLMLAFSVLFGFVKPPGLGLAARYMFTMGTGRLLRVMTFTATILPSARPWCAQERFKIPDYPHPWAQKFYTPYANDAERERTLLDQDMATAPVGEYPAEYRPNWGAMSFLINLLRPQEPNSSTGEESWFTTLKRAGGGCNDLIFSGHVLVSAITAMAWTEAYPGWMSWFLWFSVLHTAQREIRERHHYSVDVVSGIYMGFLLWRVTGFLWSSKDKVQEARLKTLAKLEGKIMQAAKDGDVGEVRQLLEQLEDDHKEKKPSRTVVLIASSMVTTFSLLIALLAFTMTVGG